MKFFLHYFLVHITLLISCSLYAQVGIGTATPNASSVLDVFSNDKGLLMPRLTTSQRDLITEPATGLIIYNTTLNDGQLNIGTPIAPYWTGIIGASESVINSVTDGVSMSTTSYDDLLVTGMSISPPAGTYMVLFNAQIMSNETFGSDKGVTDINELYNTLMDMTGGEAHGLVFGNDEILDPGVYDVTGATSIAGTLTIDGGGNSNSVFIIRGTGAFTTGTSTTVNLINGASSNNIFWVSEGAMSTGAPTIMKGNLISHNNAIALGANTNLEGRIFSTTGALTMGSGSTVIVPAGDSSIDLGILSTFVMFSSNGAISGCPTCSITGDVGTATGAATAFEGINGTVYYAGTESNVHTTTFSIYQNGILVENSSRYINVLSAVVNLQGIVNVIEGESIEIRWKVDEGEATLGNRTLSLIRSGN